MTLTVVDAGPGPRTHALVIGIGGYEYLSLNPPMNYGRSFPARSLHAEFRQVSRGMVAWPARLGGGLRVIFLAGGWGRVAVAGRWGAVTGVGAGQAA